MKRLSTWLKNIRPVKVLAAGLVAMLLFVTQACNSVSATKPNAGEKSEYYAPQDAKAKSPYEGGMNNFSDTDARATDVNKAKAKAEALKEQAESNILNKGSINAAENARRVADDSGKLGRNIQNKAGSVTDKLGEETGSFVDSAKQGLKNIKNNAQDAPGYVSDQAERTFGNPVQGAKEGTKDAANAVKRTVKEADDKSSKSAYDTGRGLEKEGKNLIQEARDAVKDLVD